MVQTIINIGNSQGIIIPKEILKKLKVKKGDSLSIELEGENSIVLSKKSYKKTTPKVSQEFLSWLEEFNSRYKNALQELASK